MSEPAMVALAPAYSRWGLIHAKRDRISANAGRLLAAYAGQNGYDDGVLYEAAVIHARNLEAELTKQLGAPE